VMQPAHGLPGEPPTSEIWVDGADGARLRVFDTGQGPTCLLLHGFGEGGFVWHDLTRELALSARVLAPDLRGHGGSDWTGAGSYKFSDYVADVDGMYDRLAGPGTVLIGHSLGAAIALQIASARGDQVRGLVLLDFSPEPDRAAVDFVHQGFAGAAAETYESPLRYAAHLLQTRPLVSRRAVARLADASLRLRPDGRYTLMTDPAVVKDRKAPSQLEIAQTWMRLRQLRAPVLLVRGQGSALLSASTARQMIGDCAKGQLVTIPAAGHSLMWDNPEATVSAVSRFVRGLLDEPWPTGPQGNGSGQNKENKDV
jgi:pimeloyl-ACP methyl ester carboxylesterase